jgi:hypothetical protein
VPGGAAALLVCALGAAASRAFTAWRHGGAVDLARGAVAVWVADRDASALVGLDLHLIETLRVELDHPVRVVALEDGGAWVVCAPAGDPRSDQRLVRVDAAGSVQRSFDVGRVLDLAGDGEDGVWRIDEHAGEQRLCRTALGGERSQRTMAGATAVAARSEACLIGTVAGRVELTSGSCRDLGAGVVALAAAGAAGWWVLLEGGRLVLLDERLATAWERPLPGARRLAAPAGARQVWASGSEQVWSASPEAVSSRAGLPARGLGACASTAEGGVLVAAPGAVLLLDRRRRLASGQGGFDFLVDLASVPASVAR